MIACALDLDMPWLEDALDPEAAGPHIFAALRFSADLPSGVRLTSARLTRHKPGRRAMIEYRLSAPGGWTQVLLLKSRSRAVDRRTVALHEALSSRTESHWTVPRALGVVDDYRAWLQEWHPGVEGFSALSVPGAASAAAAIGRALAAFHRSAPLTDRRHDLASEVRTTDRVLANLTSRQRQLAPRLERLRSQLRHRAGRIHPTSPRLLHRDFYPAQVLLDGTRVVVLDLDLHALGDPALDLGNFIAHLVEFDLRHGGASRLTDLASDFLAGYQAGGGRAPASSVNGYFILALGRHVGLSTTIPGRSHTTEALLTLCEHTLAEGDR